MRVPQALALYARRCLIRDSMLMGGFEKYRALEALKKEEFMARRVGLPLARREFEGDRCWLICPACGECLELTEMKDEDSHDSSPYGTHWEANHTDADQDRVMDVRRAKAKGASDGPG